MKPIVVLVQLRSPTEGGRRLPIFSGYLATVHLPGAPEASFNDAQVFLVARDSLSPGEKARAELRPLKPSRWASIHPGSLLELWEGRRKVGEAVVEPH